ncbi:MAG: TonB family protein [Archangium sp.]|nr:TonB family protein [Archangium sp.]
MRLWAGVALWASAAVAQDAGVLTKPPALLKQVEAAFPAEQLDAGVGGTVVMEIDVGTDGRVSDARVVQSAGPAFDREALAAVRQFEFSPAEVDGAPAAVRLQYSYTFFFKQQVVEVPLVGSADAGVTGVVNFTGRLVERGTRNPVGGALITVGEGDAARETMSDDTGAFRLTDVPAGAQRVAVVVADYNPYVVEETVVAGQRTEVTYYVRRKVYGTMETVVRGKKERKEVAQITLKQEEIRLIPGTNGDAFRVVQNLPGVARSAFGLGFLVVRGGRPYDTRTYVDEVQVPVLFHFGGLFSTYNSNLLDSLSFQAGNFNSEFGRSIGGLVKGDSRTPSKVGLHGYADLNVVDVSALVETPLSENWSIAASGRRSHLDALLPAVFGLIPGANDAIQFTVAPRYYDYQVRLEYKPKKGSSRFFVSFFGSNDELVAALPNPSIDPEGRGSFGTSIVYNRLLFGFDTKVSPRVAFRTRTSFGIDSFGLTGGSDIYIKSQQYPVLSRNTFSIDIPEIKVQIDTGLDALVLPYSVDVQAPPAPKLNQVPDPFSSRRLQLEQAFVFQVEPALFATVMWKPLTPLKVVGGVRADYNSVMRKGWVDPRVALFFQLSDAVVLKGGAGLYHQPPDYRQGQLSAKFGNPDLLPEGATQYMVGSEVRFTDAISLDVQLYYKQLFNQSRSTLALGADDVNTETTDLRYTSIGKGRAYGAEILLRHALTKNFFGWVSYSLSRAERDYVGGTQYGLSQFDQPHNLIVVASYKLPLDFIVGGRLRYTSGPLNTPFVGSVYDANGNYYFPISGQQFSRRLPDFFQLDVRVDKRFVFKEWMFALYLDVQNVTYRANVEAVLNSYDYTQEAYLTGLPILPVLGMRAEW